MKISTVLPLSIATVAAAATESPRSWDYSGSWDYVAVEQTKLLNVAFDKLQQTEFIGRAVHQARLKSSQDDVSEACLTGTETVNEDSSYLDALTQLESW